MEPHKALTSATLRFLRFKNLVINDSVLPLRALGSDLLCLCKTQGLLLLASGPISQTWVVEVDVTGAFPSVEVLGASKHLI